MALTDLSSRDAVLRAIEECDSLGEDAFLARHGFGRSRVVRLLHGGRQYPAKAIVGVAHGFEFPEKGALESGEFTSGDSTMRKLAQLGFETERLRVLDRALFVVRAGEDDEVADIALDEGAAVTGWDEIGDLSMLGEGGVDRAIDAMYGDDIERRKLGRWKTAVRSFMRIKRGDMVILPITSRGIFAVGVVSGDYAYRPEGPRLASNTYPVEWLGTDLPRRLLGDLRTYVDLPPAVHQIHLDGAVQMLETMLQERQPVRRPPTGGHELKAALEAGLAAVRRGDATAVKQIIDQDLAAALSGHFGGQRPVSSGTGIGTVADVPWAGVYPEGATATAKEGVYAVYLFARDGSAVYLSFNQGTENVGGGLAVFRKRALDMQDAAGIVDAGDVVDLRSLNARPRKYEAGNAYAVCYEAGSIPDDAALRSDLETVVSYVDAAVAAGLQLDPSREPLHVMFKWSRERGADTLDQHRAMVKDKGRTWWGKLGDKSISASKLMALQRQLDDGVVTYAFLYGDQTLVRARLEAMTDDPDHVPDDEHPAQQSKEDSSFFARLSELEDLPAGWAQSGLVLASDADPAKMQGALSNQTTPLFVFERFGASAQASHPPVPGSQLTLEWLAEQTLWAESDLEELLEAIDPISGKGQVILVGPPGTGKTWVAELVARYLTQDLPLHHRLVQFHPSYGYEEFIEGIRPVASDGGIVFEVVKGTVLEMAQAIEDQSDIHVLIIDELNRANIPRVFGELLYLLEYRDETITLQYSKDFALPANLRFIATMNTADRSVRSIDVALRRRFEVFECPADGGILERYYHRPQHTTSIPNLVEGFEKLNAALTTQLDRHHTIGQSFFMAPHFDWVRLERTWRRQILPLIEDYFFDRPDVVKDYTLESFWTVSA